MYPGDNTEKIWVHQFFAKQKADVPKALKMATRSLGSAVSLTVGIRGQALKSQVYSCFSVAGL